MVEKVGYTRPAVGNRPVRRTGATGSTGFADALSKAEGAAAAEAAEAPVSVAAMTGVGALLGAQEVSEEEMHRRKNVKRGRFTLDALEQLRDGLLFGSVPISTITKLEALVAEERQLSADPRLNAILDEIELRAAVEIAKLEVSGLLKR